MKLVFAVLIVGAALVMSGCGAANYAFRCTVTQPQNCN